MNKNETAKTISKIASEIATMVVNKKIINDGNAANLAAQIIKDLRILAMVCGTVEEKK